MARAEGMRTPNLHPRRSPTRGCPCGEGSQPAALGVPAARRPAAGLALAATSGPKAEARPVGEVRGGYRGRGVAREERRGPRGRGTEGTKERVKPGRMG